MRARVSSRVSFTRSRRRSPAAALSRAFLIAAHVGLSEAAASVSPNPCSNSGVGTMNSGGFHP